MSHFSDLAAIRPLGAHMLNSICHDRVEHFYVSSQLLFARSLTFLWPLIASPLNFRAGRKLQSFWDISLSLSSI